MNLVIRHLMLITLLHGMAAWAAPAVIPAVKTDEAADAWLREHSKLYQQMADKVDSRGGYKFLRADKVKLDEGTSFDVPVGMTLTQKGQRIICLHPRVEGPFALTVIIFELANHFNEDRHAEINADTSAGRITTADEYGILRELVEYDGLRLHYNVPHDLQTALGELSAGFFQGLNTKATKLSEYQVPSAYEVIKSQKASGHRAAYKATFEHLRSSTKTNSSTR